MAVAQCSFLVLEDKLSSQFHKRTIFRKEIITGHSQLQGGSPREEKSNEEEDLKQN